ncbi:MAG: aminoacyl-histidine dipeptidase [Clostridiales bacterium]|jgi:dipeptidase D|nr:aminoacyl-histidine dipeptidase [Clostridiales bacterium]
MAILKDLRPADVFSYFEVICSIPHGSWNEKALSDHILGWARDLGLEAVQDEMWNLVIKKPGSAGREDFAPVMIQAHIDMVCEKNNDVEFDFETQGLDIYVDGDFVKARGTTLGGDNGIAVAMAMAILADNSLEHPPLEIVLTTVEEAGMDGARAVDAGLLSGKRFINVDNAEEGVFLTGCAGGAAVKISLPLADMPLPGADFAAFTIFVGGLKGGHSGMDIHLERGNSNKILGRVLASLKTPFHIMDVAGGSKDNAIPREAWAKIFVKPADGGALALEVAEIEAALKAEFKTADPGVFVRLDGKPMGRQSSLPSGTRVFAPETKEAAISLLLLTPFGVDHFSMDFPGLVETSNNLGVVRVIDGELVLTCAVRSSVESRKLALCQRIERLAEALGAKATVSDGYPGWAYSPESALRETFKKVYFEKYGKDATIVAIHAGLECGVFAEKIGGLDMISFGPNMFDLHTPDERVSISSVERCYDFFKSVLKVL